MSGKCREYPVFSSPTTPQPYAGEVTLSAVDRGGRADRSERSVCAPTDPTTLDRLRQEPQHHRPVTTGPRHQPGTPRPAADRAVRGGRLDPTVHHHAPAGAAHRAVVVDLEHDIVSTPGQRGEGTVRSRPEDDRVAIQDISDQQHLEAAR